MPLIHRCCVIGSVPSPRMGHAACLVASTLYVHGGFSDYHQVHQDLYSLDLSTFIWSRVEAQIPLPACFSHSMTPIGKYLMLFGGCPRQPATALSLIELNTGLLRNGCEMFFSQISSGMHYLIMNPTFKYQIVFLDTEVTKFLIFVCFARKIDSCKSPEKCRGHGTSPAHSHCGWKQAVLHWRWCLLLQFWLLVWKFMEPRSLSA